MYSLRHPLSQDVLFFSKTFQLPIRLLSGCISPTAMPVEHVENTEQNITAEGMTHSVCKKYKSGWRQRLNLHYLVISWLVKQIYLHSTLRKLWEAKEAVAALFC